MIKKGKLKIKKGRQNLMGNQKENETEINIVEEGKEEKK